MGMSMDAGRTGTYNWIYAGTLSNCRYDCRKRTPSTLRQQESKSMNNYRTDSTGLKDHDSESIHVRIDWQINVITVDV